jgi:glycosyltransferase involved in cell wall biosynthesis
MLKFSIIIPTYNYADYLSRALESATAQPGEDFEIVVVDDGSTDRTVQVVQSYQKNHDRELRYCFQSHRGLGAARNHGVRNSTGAFLLFLDADDTLLPESLERLRVVLAADPGVDFVTAGRVTVDTRGRFTTYHAKPLASDKRLNFCSYLLDRVIPVVNGSVTIHRRVFSTLEFPESIRLWEDRVFYARLFALFRGVSTADPLLTVYRHRDSLSHNVNFVIEDAPKTVDLIFDPAVLPTDLMSLREEYIGKIELELFQMCYSRDLYREACNAFRNAYRSTPRRVMSLKVLRRYFKMKLRRSRQLASGG